MSQGLLCQRGQSSFCPFVSFCLFLELLTFGMPAVAALPAIMLKSTLLALAAGFTAARFKRVTLPLMAAVVAAYQIIGTLGEWAIVGELNAALQDFRIGLPGMLLQIFGGWAVIRYIIRK